MVVEEGNKVLVWDVQKDAQYVIDLQGPLGTDLKLDTYFHHDRKSIIGLKIYCCNDGQDAIEINYYVTKSAISGGCHIKSHNSAYVLPARLIWFVENRRLLKVDRKGLFLYDTLVFYIQTDNDMSFPFFSNSLPFSSFPRVTVSLLVRKKLLFFPFFASIAITFCT